ncbi:hypothetical protein SAMN02910358_02603 [Lachnospiraceae bacterium XBB1006]|nr:hypothetical protein SAMN02910358_02603 [Lachnospiraceae bacterium XBB1006]
MKAVFLDIDGVLNREETEEMTPEGLTGVEDGLVENLSMLVHKTGAKIILSSDWKEEWEAEYEDCGIDGKYLVDKLARYRITISDKTADTSTGSNVYSMRGAGIKRYLELHPEIDFYAILDDKFYDDFDDTLSEHLVFMENKAGFTQKYLELALLALEGVKMTPEKPELEETEW